MLETNSLDEMSRVFISELRKIIPFDGLSLMPFDMSTGLPAQDRMSLVGFRDIEKAGENYASYFWRLDPTTAQPGNLFLRISDTIETSKWKNSEFYFDFYRTLLGGDGDCAVALLTAVDKRVAQVVLARGPRGKVFDARGKAILNMILPAIKNGVMISSLKEGALPIPARPGHERLMATAPLSNRENAIAELVIRGLSNKEIGERLYISELTVKTHMTRILRKTGARNRVELLAAMLAPYGAAAQS